MHMHCVTLLFFRLKKLIALIMHYIRISGENTFAVYL